MNLSNGALELTIEMIYLELQQTTLQNTNNQKIL